MNLLNYLFYKKSKGYHKGSFLVVGAIIILAVIAFFVIVAGIAMFAELQGEKKTGVTTAFLSCTSSQLPNIQKKQIQQNMSVYQTAANKANVPWEFLAALHYKESTLADNVVKDGPFQVQGSKYTTFSVDSAYEAAMKAKGLLQGVYKRNLSKTSEEETIKFAFLAYNRGNMYKNNGLSWNDSPYVMNQFDEAHKNMRWPNSPAEPPSTRGDINETLGAFTVYSILKGCTTARLTGKTALPIEPSKIRTYNSSLHGRSVSYPGVKDKHNVILGPAIYGTNVPDNSLGEAVDLAAIGGTLVVAPFDGKVTFASSLSALGSVEGGFIVMQSVDGKSQATLAHLQNYVPKGTILAAGQRAGELKEYIGSLGPHLHFELWVNGQPINAGGPGSGVTPAKIWAAQKKALGY